MAIMRFDGVYRFLSNFYYCDVYYDSVRYKSSEHAYQAAKTSDINLREAIRECNTPGDAKKLGRKLPLRTDWDDVKLNEMYKILKSKFSNPKLKKMLVDTGSEELIEGNNWGDVYWGVCIGRGENNLGKLLMKVRSECA